MQNNRVTILYNTSVYVLKFRMNLIARLQADGYVVSVISPVDEATPDIVAAGIDHVPIRMSQYGMNPLRELRTLLEIEKLLREVDPIVSLHYTIKPNIFGTIAAKRAGIPVINNIAGAGRLFSDTQTLISKPVLALFRYALRHSFRVFFQNDDDRAEFIQRRLVNPAKTQRIPGSGVDLTSYLPTAVPMGPTEYLFIGRLLKEKGVKEFIDASESIAKLQPDASFRIVGEHDTDDAAYLDSVDLNRYSSIPNAEYIGAVKPHDIAKIISRSTVVVLPSYYREGVPRVLLEACASGRPIITTDNVGCRDVVDHGSNGYQVPIRDVASLIEAMGRFASLSHAEKQKMGSAARQKAERVFDENFVLLRYLETIHQVRTGEFE